MRKLAPVRAAALVVALLGVLASRAGSAGPLDEDEEASCPAPLQGMSVSSHPVRGGVQLALTNPGSSQLDDLRDFVRAVAQVIQTRSHGIGPQAASDAPAVIPPVEISVEDTGDGARVTVHADRASDVDDVRALALVFERVWRASSCVETQPSQISTLPSVWL